jgi:hypothetical protein
MPGGFPFSCEIISSLRSLACRLWPLWASFLRSIPLHNGSTNPVGAIWTALIVHQVKNYANKSKVDTTALIWSCCASGVFRAFELPRRLMLRRLCSCGFDNNRISVLELGAYDMPRISWSNVQQTRRKTGVKRTDDTIDSIARRKSAPVIVACTLISRFQTRSRPGF